MGLSKFISDIYHSFFNNKSGMSARKLTAFSLITCVFYLHYKYVDTTNAFDFLVADLCAIMLLLGIVTAQNIIELKNGKTNEQGTN